MNKQLFFIILGISMLFASCSTRISGTIHEDGSADLSIRASLAPKTAALLQSFSSHQDSFSIDATSIGMSASMAPGVKSAQFKNIDPITIEGSITIDKINEFLFSSESNVGTYRFVTYNQNVDEGSLSINLDLTKGPIIISLFSPDVADYLFAIMAPLATGEVLTVSEYLNLVASVYGTSVSNEIKNAVVEIEFTVPGIVKSTNGGTFISNRANFLIPLTDLLVLEKPVLYEILWGE